MRAASTRRAVFSILGFAFFVLLFLVSHVVLPAYAEDISNATENNTETTGDDNSDASESQLNTAVSENMPDTDNTLFTGAATSRIPIDVVPGRLGMSPKLNILYNSRRGNGWLGVGFDLDAGSIQRSTKRGVTYNQTGPYVFVQNGSSTELVRRTDWGTSLTAGGTTYTGMFFGARIEGSMTRYFLVTASNRWIVQTKDGTVFYYGSTVDSRQDFSSATFKWCLDKVQDIRGNYMTFTYDVSYKSTTGELYLREIDYTGNATTGLSPVNKVVFTTEVRPSTEPIPTMYTTNYPVKTTVRLQKITVYGNSATALRSYTLSYVQSPGTGRSTLSSVTETGSDNTTLNTTFTWQGNVIDTFAESIYGNPWSWDHGHTRWFTADVNGNGKADIVGVQKNGSNVKILTAFSLGNGTYDTTHTFDPPSTSPIAWDNDFKWFPGDVNGDGKMDIVGVINSGGYVRFVTLLSDGSGSYTVKFSTSTSIAWDKDFKWFAGNVNGDKFADILGVIQSGGNIQFVTAMSNGAEGTFGAINRSDPADPVSWSGLHKWFLGDANGDGLSDIMGVLVLDLGQSAAFLTAMSKNDGTGKLNVVQSSPSHIWAGLPSAKWAVGDLNGDGKTDFVEMWDYTLDSVNHFTKFSLVTSVGDGSYTISDASPGTSIPFNRSMLVGDFNGDGKTDIALLGSSKIQDYPKESYSTYQYTLQILTSDGDGTLSDHLKSYCSNAFYVNIASNVFSAEAWIAGDVNGDGSTELILAENTWPNSPGNYFYTYTPQTSGKQPVLPDLVQTVTNSIGGTTTFGYAPSSDFPNTYLPYTLQVVDSITRNDGGANPDITTNYSYKLGLYDPVEREFRGFGYVTAQQINSARPNGVESTTQTWFDQNFTTKGTIQAKLTTSFDGNYKRQVNNAWTSANVRNTSNQDVSIPDMPGYFVTYPRLDTTVTTITDANYPSYQFTTQYTYDPTYLVPIAEDKSGMTAADEIHTYTRYTNLTNIWKLSLPSDVIVTRVDVADPNGTVSTSWNVASRKWMTYDTAKGDLQSAEACKSATPAQSCLVPNSSQNGVTTYTYTTEGNVQSVTDPNLNATTYTYDTALRTYPYTTTNAKSQVTTTTYDTATGKLTSRIPPHLQSTSYLFTYQYDSLGRLIKESRPDNGYTYYQYLNFGTPGSTTPQRVRRQEHIANPDGTYIDRYTSTFFDGLGRTSSVWTSGPDGKSIAVETDYDPVGRVSQKSRPYLYGTAADPIYYTVFTYDGFSRITNTRNPDGGNISTTYMGQNKKVCDQLSHCTIYTYDVYKRLSQTQDANGASTTYTYDALGNLTKTVAALGTSQANTTTMAYDSLSKKIDMVDPDMGHWTYQYDKNGNLTCQTDAKGQSIGFKYDALNRITEKDYYQQLNVACTGTLAHTVTNTYDTIQYSQGMLTDTLDSLTSNRDTVLTLDMMQRITKSQKTVSGTTVTMVKAYDSAGRIATISPNAAKTYAYAYDTPGNTVSIQDKSTSAYLVQYTGFTAQGQPGRATYKNTTTTDYTYWPQTGRLNTLVTNQNTTQNVTANCTIPQISMTGYALFSQSGAKTITASGNKLTFTPFSGSAMSLNIMGVTLSGSVTYATAPGIQKITASGSTLTFSRCSAWDVLGATCTSYTTVGTITLSGATASGTVTGAKKSYGISKASGSGSTITFSQCSSSTCSSYSSIGTITFTPTSTAYTCPFGSQYACSPTPSGQTCTAPQNVQTAIQNLSYVYDLKGNVKTLTDTKNYIAHAYQYDVLDRLLTAVGTATAPDPTGYTQTYAYDILGNMICKSDLSACYSYTYTNKPHAVRTAGNMTFQYDNNGNMTSKTTGGTTQTITWNEDNKPKTIGATTFTYDGFGNRVTKGSTFYFGDVYEIRGSTTIVHLFANGQRVTSIRGDGNTQYYHPNHLGSASVVTDQTGKVEERIEYYPYGTYRSRTTGMSTSGFPKVNYTFTDQEDDETGFYNYKARLYDPLVGRFISADSVVPEPGDLQSFNRYSYVKNNPLWYKDPSGHWQDPVHGGCSYNWSKYVGFSDYIASMRAEVNLWVDKGQSGLGPIPNPFYGSNQGMHFDTSGGVGLDSRVVNADAYHQAGLEFIKAGFIDLGIKTYSVGDHPMLDIDAHSQGFVYRDPVTSTYFHLWSELPTLMGGGADDPYYKPERFLNSEGSYLKSSNVLWNALVDVGVDPATYNPGDVASVNYGSMWTPVIVSGSVLSYNADPGMEYCGYEDWQDF